jgi:amino acid adenylation domain-containing protein
MSERVRRWSAEMEIPRGTIPRTQDTSAFSSHQVCVSHLVEAQAMARPYALAISAGDTVLTYKDLSERANRLAGLLRAFGVGPETVVGLCLPRSPAMIVGALGILTAGGAYLPLDPALPENRLVSMLDDAEASVVVTNPALASGGRLRSHSQPLVLLDGKGQVESTGSSEDSTVEIALESLAYVIYTSGSTGIPKGVEITHRNLLNLIHWHQGEFDVTPADRASHLASVGFDAAGWELWPYLVTGASIHIPHADLRHNAEELRNWMVSEKITISYLPTPLAERMITLDWLPDCSLRILLTGGDVLHQRPRAGLPFKVVNNYGLTECSVVSTSGEILAEEHVGSLPSIGRPIANTQVYILDEQFRQVPSGTPGEIHIGGIGVARGYRNAPAHTADRFLPNSFDKELGSRLYKTGDLGKYLPDEQIAYLGRCDQQIKIRGFRVEPEEIVAVLNHHPSVQGSAVVVRETGENDRRLAAYLVFHSHAIPTVGDLRDYLRIHLPEYMVPATFVQLESLPLTDNAKVDRSALPAPNTGNTLRDAVTEGPRTPVEARVGEILATVLGFTEIGVNDNFFLLGGHSLLGAQLIARLQDAFGVEVGLRALFDGPTVARLSSEVERLLMARLEAMSEEEACRLLDATTPTDAAKD